MEEKIKILEEKIEKAMFNWLLCHFCGCEEEKKVKITSDCIEKIEQFLEALELEKKMLEALKNKQIAYALEITYAVEDQKNILFKTNNGLFEQDAQSGLFGRK